MSEETVCQCGLPSSETSGFCYECERLLLQRDAWADTHCLICDWTTVICDWTTEGKSCPRCAKEVVLEVGIDPGADGAYAWNFADAGELDDVRSIGADERVVKGSKTKAGKAKVRRLASAECFALELAGLVASTRARLGGWPLRLVAHLEVPAPAPAQSSVTTASQYRSLGRIEGVLVALGFEVYLLTTQRWHTSLGIESAKPSGSEREGLKDDARRREGKIVSTALAKQLRPDLEYRIGEDDNRAEAVLVMIAGRKLRLERETR